MDAIATFRAYLEKKPTDRFARYSLALALAKAGREAEAEATFVELLRQHPSSGAGHYQLGLLHRVTGRFDAAQASWEAGLAALRGLAGPEARRSRSEIQSALDDLEDLRDED